jgi:predicted P-loop ATPase
MNDLSLMSSLLVGITPDDEAGGLDLLGDEPADDGSGQLMPPSKARLSVMYGGSGLRKRAVSEWHVRNYFPRVMTLVEAPAKVFEGGKENRWSELRTVIHAALKSGLYWTQLRDVLTSLPTSTYREYLRQVDNVAFERLVDDVARQLMHEGICPAGMFGDVSGPERGDDNGSDDGDDDSGEIPSNGVRVRSTIPNLVEFMRLNKMAVRYNVSIKRLEMLSDSMKWEELAEEKMAEIFSDMNAIGLPRIFGQDAKKDFVAAAALRAKVNPFAEMHERGYKRWLAAGKPDMIKELASTIIVDDEDEAWRDTVIKRFLVAGVAVNQAEERDQSTNNRMVLTLRGEQYIGKSRWIMRLVGDMQEYYKPAMTLNVHNKDSVIQNTSAAVVELGEFDGVSSSKGVAQLKNFVSAPSDTYRIPYKQGAVTFKRRTLFVATSNKMELLHDETGNTRFIPINCIAYDHTKVVDTELVWGHAYGLWKDGEQHYMTDEEIKQLKERSKAFTVTNPYEDFIHEVFDTDHQEKDEWTLMKIEEVIQKLSHLLDINPTDMRERKKIIDAIRRITGEVVMNTRVNGIQGRRVLMPPLRRHKSETQSDVNFDKFKKGTNKEAT